MKERRFQIMERIKRSNLEMTKIQWKTLLTVTPSMLPFQKSPKF